MKVLVTVYFIEDRTQHSKLVFINTDQIIAVEKTFETVFINGEWGKQDKGLWKVVCRDNLHYLIKADELHKTGCTDTDIIPVPVTEMSNEVYDLVSFVSAYHYNDSYDCLHHQIAKLEKALSYREFIQNKGLEDKIELYIAQYYEHHNALEFVASHSHKWNYSLTVLSKESVSGWKQLSDVPKFQRICDEDEMHGLIERLMIAHPTENPITRKQFYNTLVKMRKHNIDKNEWWQIFLGSEIGWTPLQFRVHDIDFKR